MGGSKPTGFGGKSGGGLFSIDDDEDEKPSFMNSKQGFKPPAPAKSKVDNFLDEDDDDEGFIPKIKAPTGGPPSMPPPLP